MRSLIPVSVLCLLGLLAGNAVAADSPWWRFWGGVAEDAAGVAGNEVASRQFTPEQQRLLRDFLVRQRDRNGYGHDDDDRAGHDKDKGGKAKPLPPGLQKKLARGGELPPGWQKKLARGEVVDGQVWSQSRRLPPELLGRLGAMPPDTEIRYIEDKVYRVIRDSREIIDILGL